MAEFNISGRMSVERLQNQFKEEFGLTLRVYNGSKFADSKATLASISEKKVEDVSCIGSIQVGNFEERMQNVGLKVQVATGDNTQLVNNKYTLNEANKLFAEQK
jgi:hypothetical protein